MTTADEILNEACVLLSDKDAKDNNWRPVAYELARRCAAAGARADDYRRLHHLCELIYRKGWYDGGTAREYQELRARLALSPDEE